MGESRKTKIPDDFAVSPRIMELAREHGWPDPRQQLDAFKDYHLAKGSLMADWEAAFRTWLRNAPKFSRGVMPIAPAPQPATRPERLPTITEEERRKNIGAVESIIKSLAAAKR